ncbi:MAG: hypothetical protein Ta2E_03420 [Mycoplasmoidaceae bacterium]|nr:MAG: hypothetical protein Ta2E_03420 [Mycoplasmoidaceae bacterium]
MIIFDLLKKTNSTILKNKLKSSIIVCSRDDFEHIAYVYSFDDSVLTLGTEMDDAARYTECGEFDNVSFSVNISETKGGEISFFINHTNLIIILPSEKNLFMETACLTLISKTKQLIALKKPLTPQIIVNKITHLVLDLAISGYYDILGKIEDDIQSIQKQLADKLDREGHAKRIATLQTDVYTVKKQIRSIENLDIPLRLKESEYFKEPHDLLLDNIDWKIKNLSKYAATVSTLAFELMQFYNSTVSDKTNTLVTRLTVLTIVINIWTVVAGLYGMNVAWLPLDEWWWGVLVICGVLLIVTILLLVWFKKKKWL